MTKYFRLSLNNGQASTTVEIGQPPPPPPAPVFNVYLSSTSSVSTIEKVVSSKTTSDSFVVYCNSGNGYVTVQETQRPTGGSTSLSVSSFYISAGQSRTISFTCTSPTGNFSNTEFTYSFAVLGSFGTLSHIHRQGRQETAPPIPQYYYAFQPSSSPVLGDAVAGHGMPADYNSSTYGQVIWPGGGNGRWVGVNFVPQTSTIQIKGTADNIVEAYLNQNTFIGSHSNWPTWAIVNVTVTPNVQNFLSFKLTDTGVAKGFAARITELSTGRLIATTNLNWASN